MAKVRTFTTLPARAIGDTRPTALDLRCLAVIALHDGMSKVKGSGGGCYARNATLAQLARTDTSNFSKSLSRLIGWGYVVREPQLMDKRKFTLRVIYGDDDSWRADQRSAAEIVGEDVQPGTELVGEADSKNGGISKENGRHYISLKEELDSVETEKLNSSEEARLGGAHFQEDVLSAESISLDLSANRGKKPAEAGLGGEWLIAANLPRNFTDLPPGAQVARIESAFGKIGRDPERLDSHERQSLTNFLIGVADDFGDEPFAQQAQRLSEEIAQW